MARDLWLTRRLAPLVDKIQETLTLAAATYDCGRRGSLYNSTNSAATFVVLTGTTLTNSIYTVEQWMKLVNITFNDEHLNISRDNVGNYSLRLRKQGTQLLIDLFDTVPASVTFTTGVNIMPNEWFHLAITRNYVAAGTLTTLKVYINGVLRYTGTTAGLGNGSVTSPFRVYPFNDAANSFSSEANCGHFRLWTRVLSIEEIQARMNLFTTSTLDSTLAACFECSGGNFSTTSDANRGADAGANPFEVNGTTQSFLTTDYPPVTYGSSFIVAQWPINLSNNCSLQYPIAIPAGTTGQLCVSWMDDSGVFQRRSLWVVAGVIIAPTPAVYRGENVGDSFTLELWNVDGAVTTVLPSAITINISMTTDPANSYDQVAIAAAAPVADSTLAENFPIAIPLTFTSQQTYN